MLPAGFRPVPLNFSLSQSAETICHLPPARSCSPSPTQMARGTLAVCHSRLCAMAILLATLLLMVSTTSRATEGAQQLGIAVQVVPDSVELSAEEEVQVLVIARNVTSEPIADMRLRWLASAPIKVGSDQADGKSLLPGAEAIWTLRLGVDRKGATEGTVHLRIDYSVGSREQPVHRFAFATVKVASRPVETVEQVVNVQVKTTIESLSGKRRGVLYLAITNKANGPLTVSGIMPKRPDFIVIQPARLAGLFTLGPHEATAVPFGVSLGSTVQPGKHLILFEIGLQWEKNGHPQIGTSIASHEITVGVLGESEILNLFAIPSLLLLPGFLMVASWGLLWRLFRTRGETHEFPLQMKTPEFWLVAITLSLFMAVAYPLVTWRFGGNPRDYLSIYGFEDIVLVWLASLGVAVVGYFVVHGLLNLLPRIRAWWRATLDSRRVPARGDSEFAILRKLHRQGRGVVVERLEVRLSETGPTAFAFQLEPRSIEQKEIWIGPAIAVTRGKTFDASVWEQLRSMLDKKVSPKILAGFLEQSKRVGAVGVRWEQQDGLDRPRRLTSAQIVNDNLEPDSIVVIK